MIRDMEGTPRKTQGTDRLDGVVIAFDIDNTLVAADPTAYRRTVTEFLSFADTGLDPDRAFDLHEGLRARGNAIERLELPNPIHLRGRAETLAVFCLDHVTDASLLGRLNIKDDERELTHKLLAGVARRHDRTCDGPPAERFDAEAKLQRFLTADGDVHAFREIVRRLTDDDLIKRWADGYEKAEAKNEPANDFKPLLADLSSMGAALVVISEGRKDVQIAKLERLGLAEVFADRVLVTESAVAIPGAIELERTINDRIASSPTVPRLEDDKELALMWYFARLMDCWREKSSAFFGRCVHTIHRNADRPGPLLPELIAVSPERWAERPLRFVMIGDRYDKDILPLIELLGPDAGLTIRLTAGKYGRMYPDKIIPTHLRPGAMFADWTALARFLQDDLSAGNVKPITTPPDPLPRTELNTDYIAKGLKSNMEAVRTVANVASAMMAE